MAVERGGRGKISFFDLTFSWSPALGGLDEQKYRRQPAAKAAYLIAD